MVAARKNAGRMLETKEVRSKAAAVEVVQDNSMLAALTKYVVYLIINLNTKSNRAGNQSIKEGHKN